MADMTCPKCDTTLVRVKRDPFMTTAGCLGIVLFFVGLASMLANPIFGLLFWVFAALVTMAGGKDEWLTCPKCKKDIVKL